MTGDPVFLALCRNAGLPKPEPEHRFHPARKFRWDYAWPAAKLALEVQGGIWTGGKHGRGSGIVKDMEKYNLGATLGWRLLLVQPKELYLTATAALIRDALAA